MEKLVFVVEKSGYLIFLSLYLSRDGMLWNFCYFSLVLAHARASCDGFFVPSSARPLEISITLWLLMQERWVSVRANAIRNTKLFTLYIHGFFNHQLYICVLSTPSRHAVSQHWAPYVEIMTEEFLYLWFRQLSIFPI